MRTRMESAGASACGGAAFGLRSTLRAISVVHFGPPQRRGRDRFCQSEGNRAKRDRKSTRLNSSHGYISYAVFCLKKKKKSNTRSSFLSSHSVQISSHA